ncbi:MAG: hypothetical protein RIA08_02895 [Roseovarius sp.]|uniref:hypothetical protein n=1 Tax=Roseovarius sp. TaxID=1486281 RepID=UPI0032EAEB1C
MTSRDDIKGLTFDVLKSRARKYAAEKEHLKAAVAYDMAGQLQPDSDAKLFQAIQLKHAGEIEKSATAYKLFLQKKPDHFDGWCSYGVMMKQNERYEEAVEALEKALALKEDAAARNAFVTSLWRLGRYDEATREGMINLRLKDRIAFERFGASPFKDVALQDRRPTFAPDRPTRNIIAFSLWGDDPTYVSGAIVNAQIAPHIYVGWTARFYCDETVPEDARAELQKYGAQVVLLQEPEFQKIRPMWRFLASDDPNVDYFVCRDADSRLNVQEFLAVDEWLRSGKRFHVMRDHIYHMELILAGMWGGVAGVLPNMRESLSRATNYFDNRFGDQAFLMDVVWPMVKADLCTHDSVYGFPDGGDFPGEYRLPGMIHVGGAVKSMKHWRSA